MGLGSGGSASPIRCDPSNDLSSIWGLMRRLPRGSGCSISLASRRIDLRRAAKALGQCRGNGQVAEWSIAHAWKACVGERLPRVRIPLCPPLPRREPAIGRPQGRKTPSNRAIFPMPSEPRRLANAVRAVSERNLSLITRTSPSAVRVQNNPHLQCFGPIDGPEVRGRYSTQCAVRETEVEVLARNSGRAWPVRPDGNRQPGRPLLGF